MYDNPKELTNAPIQANRKRSSGCFVRKRVYILSANFSATYVLPRVLETQVCTLRLDLFFLGSIPVYLILARAHWISTLFRDLGILAVVVALHILE